jgi:hypothetical protein
MNAMDRLRDLWNSPTTRALGRLLGGLARLTLRLVGVIVRELGFVWLGFSPRARIFLIIGGLVALSAFTSEALPSLGAVTQGLAVLLLASVGLWVVLTSPFRSRRWW